MSLLRLVLKNLKGNAFRSAIIVLCAALVAAMALTATFVVRGAESSLRANLQRLGADILVLPWGTMTEKIGGVRLMSAAIDGWMPRAYLERVAAVDGVAEVSPQLHLASLQDSPYSSQPEMFLVAIEPSSDFTVRPWLEGEGQLSLGVGEAIAGAHINVPSDGELTMGGMPLRLQAQLQPTATSIDSTLFVSFDTAEEMAARSSGYGSQNLNFVPDSISAMMVRIDLGSDPHLVAVDILEHVRGVVPLETPGLFQSERQQMIGVLRTMLSLLGIIWVFTLVFMAMVFTVSVNERRWEIGVLRALGLPRGFVLKELLLEGAILALAGGFLGVIMANLGLIVFGDHVVQAVRLPLRFPSPTGLLSLSIGGQVLALLSVILAASLPVWRISHQEVAINMRE